MEFDKIDTSKLPTCRLCGYVSAKLINGLCEQCSMGEVDDPHYTG